MAEVSCDNSELERLKERAGFKMHLFKPAETNLTLAFWAYVPEVYMEQDGNFRVFKKYPTIVWNHGGGQGLINRWGTSKFLPLSDPTYENSKLEGPYERVVLGLMERQYIMIIPVNNVVDRWIEDPVKWREVIDFSLTQFPIDQNQLFMIGHSFGGRAVLEYMTRYAGDEKIVKAVAGAPYLPDISRWAPVVAGTDPSANVGKNYIASNSTVPILIVGAADDKTSNMTQSIEIADARSNVELTLLVSGDHNAVPAYFFVDPDGVGMSQPLETSYANNYPYNQSVYDWLHI